MFFWFENVLNMLLDYTDSEILLAILSQHTLNPVLETVANVVLDCTNRYEIMQQFNDIAWVPYRFVF